METGVKHQPDKSPGLYLQTLTFQSEGFMIVNLRVEENSHTNFHP